MNGDVVGFIVCTVAAVVILAWGLAVTVLDRSRGNH